MAKERTFSIIKPDATRRNLTGKINAKFEDAGLHDRRPAPGLQLSEAQAKQVLRGPQGAPVLQRPGEVHDHRPGRGPGAGGRRRRRQEPQGHGRHQPGQCRCRHHPQGIRRIDRGQLGPRFGQRPRTPRSRSPSSSARSRSSAEHDGRRNENGAAPPGGAVCFAVPRGRQRRAKIRFSTMALMMMRPPKPNTNMPRLGPLIANSTVTRVSARDSMVPPEQQAGDAAPGLLAVGKDFVVQRHLGISPFSLVLARSFTRAWAARQCAESRRFGGLLRGGWSSPHHRPRSAPGARFRPARPAPLPGPRARPASAAALAPAAIGTGGASTTMFSGQCRRIAIGRLPE